jgi:hypothetical protein
MQWQNIHPEDDLAICIGISATINRERLGKSHHLRPRRHRCEFSAYALLLPEVKRAALDATA